MTYLQDLGWWGVALVGAIALVALVVLVVALVGGLRQARREAAAERAAAQPDDDSTTDDAHTPADTAGTAGAAAADAERVGDPLRQLELRYARGEIDREDYLQRRADLEGR